MENLTLLSDNAIQTTLKILLQDKTTKKNIIWATNSYQKYGEKYGEQNEITYKSLKKMDIADLQPRVLKTQEVQKDRTKKRAEVFTPSWLCNKMNNSCDEQWFGRTDVFNVQINDTGWKSKTGKIKFEKIKGKTWQDYVLSRRIEITCGEAPFLVSRYDTTTGNPIPVSKRIGILDRKLRVVNENTTTEEDWFSWVVKAYQSTYGYEFQGDNLLIARINLVLTFVDYMNHKWKKDPTQKQLMKIARIISWNVWQMDGLTCEIPLGGPIENEIKQAVPVKFDIGQPDDKCENNELCVKIRNWRHGTTSIPVYFKDLAKEKK